MDLQSIALCERNRAEKDKPHLLSLIYGTLKPKQNGHLWMEIKLVVAQVKADSEKGKNREGNGEVPPLVIKSVSHGLCPVAQGTQSLTS